jgi:hypothetical protein
MRLAEIKDLQTMGVAQTPPPFTTGRRQNGRQFPGVVRPEGFEPPTHGFVGYPAGCFAERNYALSLDNLTSYTFVISCNNYPEMQRLSQGVNRAVAKVVASIM